LQTIREAYNGIPLNAFFLGEAANPFSDGFPQDNDKKAEERGRKRKKEKGKKKTRFPKERENFPLFMI